MLTTEMSLRRGSDEVVKMQDRRHMNPKNNDLMWLVFKTRETGEGDVEEADRR